MTVPTSTLMAGKTGLIMGAANEKSLAWAIALGVERSGGDCIMSFANPAVEKRLTRLVGQRNWPMIPCDVGDDTSIDEAFEALAAHLQGRPLDFLVHAISYSDKEELRGAFLDTTRSNFRKTLDISCYSLVAVAQRAAPLMTDGGAILTLTYLGSERVIPNYNVMGVAKAALEASVRYLASDLGARGVSVNALSAGPIRTLASSGIDDIRAIVSWTEHNSMLRRQTTLEDVASAAIALIGPLGRGVTGELVHVDGGYHATGMVNLDRIGESAALLAALHD